MEPNDKAFSLIAAFEGCVLKAYPDPATGGDPWTIGYGATGPDIKPGVVWTKEKADTDLKQRIAILVGEVQKLVTKPLPSDCIAVLVSFAYNVGIDAFKKSTLLRKINNGNAREAAEEFKKWTKAGGKVFPILVKRRAQERQVYIDALLKEKNNA